MTAPQTNAAIADSIILTDLMIKLAVIVRLITNRNIRCTDEGGYPCPNCTGRAAIIAAADQLTIMADDYLGRRRTAKTPEHTTAPQTAADDSPPATTRLNGTRP